MLLHIPALFAKEEVQRIREALEQADWADGKITAGYQSAKAKHNLQLPEDHPLAKEIGAAMMDRLWKNPLFMSAALPHKVFPPLVNCYTGGGSFDFHIDNAVRQPRGSPERVRTDLSATLFFSNPEDYDGGELVSINSSRVFYRLRFFAEFQLGRNLPSQPAESWHERELDGLSSFTGVTVRVDAIDPADPNLQRPGPDGRVELTFSGDVTP